MEPIMLKVKGTAHKHCTLVDKAVFQLYELTIGYKLKCWNCYTYILEFNIKWTEEVEARFLTVTVEVRDKQGKGRARSSMW